jgi:CDP-diacylglycerol---glycerol-3-phosphate 3-phosphatidyltransferase
MLKLTQIPWILIGLRVTIAPLLLLDVLDGTIGNGFITGYTFAVFSNIFDGIIARRLGSSTIALRQADSWADISLYLCIAISTWFVHPDVFTQFQIPLLLAIAAQITLFAISLIKFGEFPSFHTYTAKAWGVSLFIAVVGLFGFNHVTLLWGAIVLCWINSVEEIIMIFMLSEWTHDVLSVFHARKLRDH